MPTTTRIIKTTSTRELHLRKLDDGTYEIRLYWGRGDRDLATLIIEPQEWEKLVRAAQELAGR